MSSSIREIYESPTELDAYRLATLRSGLRLELKGIRVHIGGDCYSILQDLGFKGSREEVLQQVTDEVEYIKANL